MAFSQLTAHIKKSPRLTLLLAFLLGSLSVLSMAPFNVTAFLFLTLSGLYWLFQQASSSKHAFAIGYSFAFGYFLFGLYWIANALLVEGNGYRWAYPLAVTLIPAGLAFYWGGALWLAHKLKKSNKPCLSYAVFIACLCVAELARSTLLTGFPWNLMGYSWVKHLPLIQICAYISIYGLTLLTLIWASLPAFIANTTLPKKAKALITFGAILSFASIYGWGQYRLNNYFPAPLPYNVQIPNVQIPQAERWVPEKLYSNFQKLIAASVDLNALSPKKPTLIVWPETALPGWYLEDPMVRAQIGQALSLYDPPAYLLTGTILSTDNEHFENALIAIDSKNNIFNKYAKTHLVPFGEYIPFQKHIPLQPVNNFKGFEKGNGPEIFTLPDHEISYVPAICYEIIFPYALYKNKKDTRLPDVIVNVTNDAWYEGTTGPAQHFTQVIFRAIEYNTPVIRVANQGISAVINEKGQIIQSP